MQFDVERVRRKFPALSLTENGVQRVYFDNPGGTQVPEEVISRITRCLIETNANLGGQFQTTEMMGQLFTEARAAMADFLGAASADEIIFGQNMTSLTFHMSRCIGKSLAAGDEIVLTEMDHEGNISPWLQMAEDRGCSVKWLPFDPDSYEFDLDRLEDVLSPKTRVVALNFASNLLGTVNDIRSMTEIVRKKAPSAIVYVDAVQFAAHALTDVQALGCDMLVCSPYKFFGPHTGVLWGRREVLERLQTYKARPSADVIPYRFETGTLGHESAAGVLGTVEYFEWVGREFGYGPAPATRREAIERAWGIMAEHERLLLDRLLTGLKEIGKFKIHGITNPNELHKRAPVVAITCPPISPSVIARSFSDEGINLWSGNSYAIEACRRLGLLETGGAVRIGLAHYNTIGEIDRLLHHAERLPGLLMN
ncbi:cysteine desulfurase-like protein [Mesorhizobium sp. A623]